jgi:hypothetical protein
MKKEYENDQDLFALMKRELFTAVVGDVMDKMGFLHQFLPPDIGPLRNDLVLAGRAMTVLEADFFAERDDNAHGPLSTTTTSKCSLICPSSTIPTARTGHFEPALPKKAPPRWLLTALTGSRGSAQDS